MQSTSSYNVDDLLLHMPGLVWLKDLNLNYVGVSKSLTDFMGVTHEDVLGKDDSQSFKTNNRILYGKYQNKIKLQN